MRICRIRQYIKSKSVYQLKFIFIQPVHTFLCRWLFWKRSENIVDSTQSIRPR